MERESVVSISKDHPSLAGHFPGHPVVPGVVILGEVMQSIRRTAGASIEFLGMPSIKFLSPLRAEEAFTITVAEQPDGTTEFVCKAGSRQIAGGCFYCSSNPRSFPW